jgi:hypothetical protein
MSLTNVSQGGIGFDEWYSRFDEGSPSSFLPCDSRDWVFDRTVNLLKGAGNVEIDFGGRG